MTPLTIDPFLLLLLLGFLFTLMFGGLSLLRREGLSTQFALESVGITAVLVGGGWLVNVALNPVFFLVLLYLLTMRSRLLVDVANMMAVRGSFDRSFSLYRLGLALWPDVSSRLIVLANRGAAELRSGQAEAAIRTLEDVLSLATRPHLGLKYESACRYNLGVAYDRCGEHGKAAQQFNEVIDMLPGTPHARAAQAALERRQGSEENPRDS